MRRRREAASSAFDGINVLVLSDIEVWQSSDRLRWRH